MNLSTSPRLRLLTLCALYVAQGVPFGFATITLKAYLAERGLGVAEIGTILAMVNWPWAFKWVWGPVIDRFGFLPMGRRRPWILLAQTLMALTIGAMIAIPDLVAGVVTLSWMILLHNVFVSLQDVSVDALAVDLLSEEERGKANGLMFAAAYLGIFIGGAGMGLLASYCNLRVAMSAQVAILLGIMLLPLLLRERAGERLLPWTSGRTIVRTGLEPTTSVRALFTRLARAFSLRSTLLGAVLALTVKIATGVVLPISAVLVIHELRWSKEDLIRVEGAYAVWLGLAGATGGGFLADRIGARRLAGIVTILLGATWIAFSLAQPLWPCKSVVITVFLVQETLLSVLTVSLLALYMAISWPAVAATQFTAYMALLNLSQTFGSKIAGSLSPWMSTGQIYLCAGLFQIALVALLPWIDPRQTRRILENAE